MSQSLRVAFSAAILVGALCLLLSRSSGEAVPLRNALDGFPTAVSGWQGQEATIFDVEVLNLLRVKDYVLRRYLDGAGRSLWLYVAYWDTQRRGAQIHSPKNCLPGSGWEPLEASVITVPVTGGGAGIPINRYLLQKDRELMLVFYWYHSQGRAIASEIDARIETVRSAMLRNRTDGALIRISSPIYGTVPDTEAMLVRYVQAVHPHLADYLPD